MTEAAPSTAPTGSTAGAAPPASPARSGRTVLRQLVAACLAAAAAGALAVAAVEPAAALAVVAALQLLLILAVGLGSRLPGRYGVAVLMAAAAIAADVAMSVWASSELDPLLGVLALALPALFVHQLARGTGRVALTASLSGAAGGAVTVVSLVAWVQLTREDGGELLACGSAIAVGAALATAMVVDGMGLGPRIDDGAAPTVGGLVVGTVVGAVAGGAVLGSGDQMGMAAGVAVASTLSVLAVLLGLGATMTAAAGGPEARRGAWSAARPVLLVAPVLAAAGPVAYVVGLAVQG